MKYAVGIDPGTKTGCAIWDVKNRCFDAIFSGSILEIMAKIEIYTVLGKTVFFIENPNLRKWYGKNATQKQQGAGSVKRDYSIWLEWFAMHQAEYVAINPKDIRTKVNAQSFRNLTGWQVSTNEHSRDAAMIVFGK